MNIKPRINPFTPEPVHAFSRVSITLHANFASKRIRQYTYVSIYVLKQVANCEPVAVRFLTDPVFLRKGEAEIKLDGWKN